MSASARPEALTELWRAIEQRGGVSHAMDLTGASTALVEDLIAEAERRLRDMAAVG